jgi:hypothetical protein
MPELPERDDRVVKWVPVVVPLFALLILVLVYVIYSAVL